MHRSLKTEQKPSANCKKGNLLQDAKDLNKRKIFKLSFQLLINITFTESLILAQDERWRRA
jgi:hypothetical protein